MNSNLRSASALVVVMVTTAVASGFGGENPLGTALENWHHAAITRKGAKDSGLNEQAALQLAFHSDYVDSYLYNPMWWGKAATISPLALIQRLQAAAISKKELTNVHFDDLISFKDPTSTKTLSTSSKNSVDLQLRRYLTGTLDGIIYAQSIGDPAMARHILGVSLHAIQDFYSHSNWMSSTSRWNATTFCSSTHAGTGVPTLPTDLYSGTYELPSAAGIDSHGKYAFPCTALRASVLSTALSVACVAPGPFSEDTVCTSFIDCRESRSLPGVRIPLSPDTNQVVKLDNVIYQNPPGMNLDSSWLAPAGMKTRGFKETDPKFREGFPATKRLATIATQQWIERVSLTLRELGMGEFWTRVANASPTEGNYDSPDNNMLSQFEDNAKLGYQFVGAGTYPPVLSDDAEEHFLRLDLTTGQSPLAGTDADIKVTIGQNSTLLDLLPIGRVTESKTNEKSTSVLLAVNDFESGSRASYLVGPLKSIPESIKVTNTSATSDQIIEAAIDDVEDVFNDAIANVWKTIGDFLSGLTGGKPDRIAPKQLTLRSKDLPSAVGGESVHTFVLNGGDEGRYDISIRITKTSEQGGLNGTATYDFIVKSMKCVRESKLDRLTFEDEPFFIFSVNGHSDTRESLSKVYGPYDNVNTGDLLDINSKGQSARIGAVTVARRSPVISIALLGMESDDESRADRTSIANKFTGKISAEAEKTRRSFVNALAAAIAPDLELSKIRIWGFSKGRAVRSGQAYSTTSPQWLEAGKSLSIRLAGVPYATRPDGTLIQATDLMREVPQSTACTVKTVESKDHRPGRTLFILLVGAMLPAGWLYRFGRKHSV